MELNSPMAADGPIPTPHVKAEHGQRNLKFPGTTRLPSDLSGPDIVAYISIRVYGFDRVRSLRPLDQTFFGTLVTVGSRTSLLGRGRGGLRREVVSHVATIGLLQAVAD